MRGHWISTTRKLNKHYQSARVGEPPVDDQFGLFYLCNACVSDEWYHVPTGASVWNNDSEFYNMIGTHPARATSSSESISADRVRMSNLANGFQAKGYRYNRDYDGVFLPNPTTMEYMNSQGQTVIFTPDETLAGAKAVSLLEKDLLVWHNPAYALGPKGHNRIVNPLASNEYDGFESGMNIYKTFGIRYVRLHACQYGSGPAYFTVDDPYMAQTQTWTNEFFKYHTPVYNGISLSAKATRAASLGDVSGTPGNNRNSRQSIIVTEEYVSGSHMTRELTVMPHNNTYRTQDYSIYDLEQNGESYTTGANGTFYVCRNGDAQQGTVACKLAIYVFFYDGDLYYDLIPHTLDPDTGEEIDTGANLYVSHLCFPRMVSGFIDRDAYVQHSTPGVSYPAYWVNNKVAGYDQYAQAYTFKNSNGFGMEIGNEYIIMNETAVLPRFYPITETEFWEIEDLWHQEHGGDSRLTMLSQSGNIS